MTDRTIEFDDKVAEILAGIKDVPYFDTLADNVDMPFYVVFHRDGEMGASQYRNKAIAGHQEDVYEHPFFIEVVSADINTGRKIASYIKEKLVGAILISGASGINVQPSYSQRNEYDAEMRPTKFVNYLSFSVRLDRSNI